jgi:peptidyl-lysine (3S)-dioxygenase / protease
MDLEKISALFEKRFEKIEKDFKEQVNSLREDNVKLREEVVRQSEVIVKQNEAITRLDKLKEQVTQVTYPQEEVMKQNAFSNPLKSSISTITRDYWSFPIDRVHVSTLTEVSFLRDYVVPRRPVILLGGIDHWNALQSWSHQESGMSRMISLCNKDATTSIQCTPDGYGDCVRNKIFIKPLDRRIRFQDALERIYSSRIHIHNQDKDKQITCEKVYLSGQDDNLRKDLPELLQDLGKNASVCIATSALGGETDVEAINLWIGTYGSVSSVHKDNYDNLMSVISGCKRFLLLPPSDLLFLHEEEFHQATYNHNDNDCKGNKKKDQSCWSIKHEIENGTIPWIPIDLEKIDLELYPNAAYLSPMTIDILAGETLFLPALWYHQVSHPLQDKVTIAVNSWRDFNMMSASYTTHEILSKIRENKGLDKR